MAPVFFKDVSKKANDLLKKDFVGNHEFEIKNKTTNGLEFTTAGKRNGVGFDIDFEVEYNDKPAGLKVKEKLNKDQDMTLEVSLANRVVDGLKVGVESVTTKGKPKTINAKLEFTNKNSSSEVVVDLQKLSVDASTVVGYENVLAGAKTHFDANKGSFGGADCVASYSGADMTITAGVNTGKDDSTSVTGTYVYNLASVAKDATLAGSYTYNLKTSASSFSVGGLYKCDANSSVKAKIESNGLLSLVYSQKMNNNLTLGLGTNIKTSQLGGAESQEVGVSLKYSS